MTKAKQLTTTPAKPSTVALGVLGLAAALCLAGAHPAMAQAKKKTAGKVAPTAAKAPAAPVAAKAPVAPADKAPAAAGAPSPDAAPSVKIERGAGGKKIYRITSEITITGKIQKPEAFYVLQKSGINYEWTELKQDVLPKIIDSVSSAPF